MPSTEKLYLDNPYETAFQASVLRSERLGGGKGYAVVLDRSCFYPDSGGQLPDRGTLGGCDVVDVREADEGEVVHHVSAGDAPVGTVECRIDWERRYDHMQQHTGQHVLSRAFIETAGLYTVSFHMGEDTCTIDLEGPTLDEVTVRNAEALANRVVAENRRVVTRSVPVGSLEGAQLRRSVPDGVSDVRLVEVEDFDNTPCCGTHVAATGELRLIKILKHEKAKGYRRVYFVVGRRAIDDYAAKHDVVQLLAGRLTTSPDGLGAKVEKLLAENQSSRKAMRQLSGKLAVLEKDLLLAATESEGGVRIVVRVLAHADAPYLRVLSRALQDAGSVVAVLGANDGSVVCAASEDTGVRFDAAADLARAMGGSGGGKAGFAQIRLPQGSDVEGFLRTVQDDVRQSL